MFAYVERNQNLKDLKDLHCTAGSSRSFTAIRKDAWLYSGSRLRKGEVFAYVGRNQNLKDQRTCAALYPEGMLLGYVGRNSNPKGPKGPEGLSLQSFLRKSLGHVGRNQNLKDLKDLKD